MPLLSPSLPSHLFSTRHRSPSLTPFPILPRKTLATRPLLRRCRAPPGAFPLKDEDLSSLTSSSAPSANGPTPHLPAARSYESDLASLTLVGAASTDQALTAAAADGGALADEHLAAGSPTMVIETVFPGAPDEHSTVSTRLFMPTDKVRDKARKLRRSILSNRGSLPENILAMTFRQVVIHNLWSFKLVFYSAGVERDMTDLASPRTTPAEFTVSSSDRDLLSALAEVVFSCALASTAREHGGGWFQKQRRITSRDSAVCLGRISEGEIVESARRQVGKFDAVKGEMVNRKRRGRHWWWVVPNYTRLERAGGAGFSSWTNEFVPAYMLQIDSGAYKDVEFEGWKKLDGSRWEVLLTHFQMVELANILDMYYEDLHTIPDKQLSCGLLTETSNISTNKFSSLKMLFATIAGGCILISVSILAQVCWPHLLRAGRASGQSSLVSSSGADCCLLKSPEDTKLEALSVSVIRLIKDDLSWPGNVVFDKNIGAWTGILPSYLKDEDSVSENATSNRNPTTNFNGEDLQRQEELSVERADLGTESRGLPTAAQNIASYQVVLSGDGKIIGFQPTSRVAVNHWACNPLARVLYSGKELSPGFWEPSLKIPRPSEVVVLEVLMSMDPQSYFALARVER